MRAAYVDVAGAGDARRVADEMSVLLATDKPSRVGEQYFVQHNDIRMWVSDDDPAENDGFPVVITVAGGPTGANAAARQTYDFLAESTDWDLRLLSEGAAVLAQRPATSDPSG